MLEKYFHMISSSTKFLKMWRILTLKFLYSTPSINKWFWEFFFNSEFIFPNTFRNHDIFYDQVRNVDKFFTQNYGAHIWPWRSPVASNRNFQHISNGQNPGGDVKIWDIFFQEVWPLMDHEEWVLILNYTIFGYKIFEKF